MVTQLTFSKHFGKWYIHEQQHLQHLQCPSGARLQLIHTQVVELSEVLPT